MAASKRERLAEFYRRLTADPPPSTHDEALGLITRTLNNVEDEMSGVPYDPALPRDDGRMYPPQPDAARSVSGHPEVTRYRSRKHNTLISENGAIEIRDADDGSLLFSKAGRDGKGVPDHD